MVTIKITWNMEKKVGLPESGVSFSIIVSQHNIILSMSLKIAEEWGTAIVKAIPSPAAPIYSFVLHSIYDWDTTIIIGTPGPGKPSFFCILYIWTGYGHRATLPGKPTFFCIMCLFLLYMHAALGAYLLYAPGALYVQNVLLEHCTFKYAPGACFT